jgi:hypothetical protein
MHRAVHFARRAVVGRTPAFSSLSRPGVAQPNARLDVDLEILLRDVDTALHVSKQQKKSPQELDAVSALGDVELGDMDHDSEDRGLSRKSPAAIFGSQQLGQIILPLELQDTIQRLISGEYVFSSFQT